jgi:signal transduction histidine kinase
VQRVVVERQTAQPDRRIDVHTAGDLSCDADPERLAQVVSNLLGNALQHGARDEAVLVRLDGTAAAAIALTVENGGEIAPDALPHLFEAFVRGGAGRSREDGLGLGLYITQQIAVAHGGGVSARSEGGRTSIAVSLPRRAPAAAGQAKGAGS